jgi:hypothetical protein
MEFYERGALKKTPDAPDQALAIYEPQNTNYNQEQPRAAHAASLRAK